MPPRKTTTETPPAEPTVAAPAPDLAPVVDQLREENAALRAEVDNLRRVLSTKLAGKSFNSAFAEARRMGLEEFYFNGTWYHTRTLEEEQRKRA